jgi:hypothetical protein
MTLHQDLIALKLIVIDTGDLILPGSNLWEVHPCTRVLGRLDGKP